MTNPEIQKLQVERWSICSSRPIGQVVATVEAAIGHPDVAALSREISEAKTPAELQAAVQEGLGPSGFMEFARYDLGGVLRKESARAPHSYRLVIGNPLIMKEMVKHVPDAGSYAPVTVLIDQRADGVHLSYDRMASFLASYGHAAALQVAKELDTKVEALLTEAAR
jgi:uncharacterized protein (DUF302 family)